MSNQLYFGELRSDKHLSFLDIAGSLKNYCRMYLLGEKRIAGKSIIAGGSLIYKFFFSHFFKKISINKKK
jgi:hypothetical protein